MVKRVRLRDDEREWTVEVGEADVTVDGFAEHLIVDAGPDDGYTVRQGDDTIQAAAVQAGDAIWVEIDHEVFEFHLARAGGDGGALEHDAMTPPMSATVTRIAVGVGQPVSTGDVLIALEAMKMELPIRAPRDGVVSAIRCREGDLVQPGQVLIEL
jgi:biotin carboxyl carrier protein